MTPDEIAAARAVIRHELIGSVVRQTTATMMTGAMAGIIMGGLIICLECGLLYAEGAITWEQMIEKIIEATLFAGALSVVITGLIVGLASCSPRSFWHWFRLCLCFKSSPWYSLPSTQSLWQRATGTC